MKRQKEWALEFSIRRIGIVIKKKKELFKRREIRRQSV